MNKSRYVSTYYDNISKEGNVYHLREDVLLLFWVFFVRRFNCLVLKDDYMITLLVKEPGNLHPFLQLFSI